jgi:hypothetical protein
MTFTEAMERLSADHRDRVNNVLRILGESAAIYYRAVCNVERESRLLPAAWEELLAALVVASDDSSSIRRTFIDCLRRWTLNGPPLTLFTPKSFGRATTTEYFSRLLVEKGYFASVPAAKSSIRSLLMKPQEVVARRWQRFDLGKYLMWSTFSTGANQDDPFDGMPSSADAIRGALGLDPNERGQPLLLMVYALPSGVLARFPTVAEAFAGERWNYFFTPAPVGAPYGMAMPWPECEDSAPRPEVVHEVILGINIIAPLKRIL